MASYLEVNGINNSSVIDDDFFNVAFIKKMRFTFSKEVGTTYYYRELVVPIAGITNAILAITSNVGCTITEESSTSATIVATASNADGIANSVNLLNSTEGFVEVFIFGRLPTSSVPSSGSGLVCYGADGGVVYYSGASYLVPVELYIESGTYRPMMNTNYNVVTKTVPTGKKYAAVPLFKLYTAYSEWASGGQDTIAMSSVCCVGSGKAIFSSNSVYFNSDLVAIYGGYCRHAYLLVDVTGL